MNTYQAVIKIQKYYKGYLYRRNKLPNSILYIQNYLKKKNINITKQTNDGRINSSIDENLIIDILKKLHWRMIIPEKRHWFDFMIYDFLYGWLPVNIKITTTETSDNIGNLAICVYSLTDEKLKLKKSYSNGSMSKILISKLKMNKLNNKLKKDYYFLVINKINTKDIIVNSFKGLNLLTPNINNLPFQIKWKDNKIFKFKDIKDKFLKAISKPKYSWREEFLFQIREIEKTIT